MSYTINTMQASMPEAFRAWALIVLVSAFFFFLTHYISALQK